MKRLWKAILISCMGLMFMLGGMSVARATDVWVDHWNYENIDVYVMSDTLSYGTQSSGKWFSVSAKMVQNGRLKEVITWRFSQFRSDMWRYSTNTMRGNHTTVVIPRNGIFEYGMNRIGWSYYIDNMYYY